MSYFDHICRFDDPASADALIATHESATVLEIAMITQDAVWTVLEAAGEFDPARALTTPEERLSGHWVMISARSELAALKASPSCVLIASRQLWREGSPFGFLTHFNWDAGEFASVLYFNPAIAGVGYPAGA